MAKPHKKKVAQALGWRCIRCKAGAEWISRDRKRCLRCGAGREWLADGRKVY